MAFPARVQEFILADVNSEVTTTTTILSGCAVPIDWLVYVATFPEALTPAGFAVLVIPTAKVYERYISILTQFYPNPLSYLPWFLANFYNFAD